MCSELGLLIILQPDFISSSDTRKSSQVRVCPTERHHGYAFTILLSSWNNWSTHLKNLTRPIYRLLDISSDLTASGCMSNFFAKHYYFKGRTVT